MNQGENKFLDTIASSSSYPCGSVDGWFIVSDFAYLSAVVAGVWTQVDACGPWWTLVDQCGPWWTHEDPSGPSWTKVEPSGPMWTQVTLVDPSVPMWSHVESWTQVDLARGTQVDKVDPSGPSWTQVDQGGAK